MTNKYLKCAAVIIALLAPAAAFAAEGDPGTGKGDGSKTPDSQPVAPKQGAMLNKMGASPMNRTPDATPANDGSAKMDAPQTK